MTYSGAWRSRATLVAGAPPRLALDLDPEHAQPHDQADPTNRDMTGAPGLPPEWDGTQYVQGQARPAYVDETPVDHMAGLGSLPGVTLEQAQAVGNAARSVDLGADDARRYVRPRTTEGVTAHAEIVSPDYLGTSPQTVRLQERGVGAATDPQGDARHNRRIARWHDRPIDMHRYEPEARPFFRVQASGSKARPAVVGRTANVSPFAAGVNVRPETFTRPVVRRGARGWDEHLQEEPAPVADFGLGQWGL